MAKGISISIASETREFQRGVQRGLIDPLENAAEILDEVGKAGDDAGEKLEGALTDSQRDADQLSDEMRVLKDRIDDAGKKSRDFGDAGRRAGRDYGDGMDRAKRGVDEFGDEANSTAREAAASFDGSAESIGDAFQEVAANAFGGFGPIGAAAGLAAAAGIGLAAAGFEDLREAEEESKRRIDEWAAAYIDAGGRVLSAQTYVAAANAILTDNEQYAKATRNAELWGVSIETAIAAMTGQHDALAEAQRNVTAAAEEEAAAMEGVPYDDVGTNIANMNSQAAEAQRALNGITGEMEAGAERADIMSQYLRDLAENTEGATAKVDEFGDTVYELPDGTTVYVDAETGQATANVDAIEQRLYGIPDAYAQVHVSTSRAQSILSEWAGRPLSKRVVIHMMTQAGISLPV